jgi:RNA polymerase sigma factor (TIGR02999 family)
MHSPGDITVLLERWRLGEAEAFDRLVPEIYDRLRQVAAGYMARERPGHTLQATGLVNEVFVHLLRTQGLSYRDRTHFYTFAAKLMRRILVDYARRHRSRKRGDGVERVPLAPELKWVDIRSGEMLDLDAALDELAKIDEAKVQVIEIRFFLGATAEETAELLGWSRAAVDRAVRFALSWLHARLTLSPP